MPKADGAKTKSEHKGGNERNLGFSHRSGFWRSQNLGLLFSWAARHRKAGLYTVGVILALLAVLGPTIFYRAPTAELTAGGHKISLQIANTDAAREKGLGGRQTLPADKGMIFVFSQAGKQCFWMKDMRFPLDMVFVSHAKQVVRIQPDVSPKTYPKSFCAERTQYVIELNAGNAKALGIHTGQKLNF